MDSFKVGDKVMYLGDKYTIHHLSDIIESADIHNDKTNVSVRLQDLKHYVEAPTIDVASHEEHIKGAEGALNLSEYWDSNPLKGRLKVDLMYCHCGSSNTVLNSAYGNVFTYCKDCKKERQ
jgi:hypothetical protein